MQAAHRPTSTALPRCRPHRCPYRHRFGAGPFETTIEQEFYESGERSQIIDNTVWQGADEANYGIDIIRAVVGHHS